MKDGRGIVYRQTELSLYDIEMLIDKGYRFDITKDNTNNEEDGDNIEVDLLNSDD